MGGLEGEGKGGVGVTWGGFALRKLLPFGGVVTGGKRGVAEGKRGVTRGKRGVLEGRGEMGTDGEGEGEYFCVLLLVCERWHTWTDSANFTCFPGVFGFSFFGDL